MGVERLKRMQKPLAHTFSFLLIIRRNAIVGPERQWLLSQLDSMIRRLNVIAALGEFRRGLKRGTANQKGGWFLFAARLNYGRRSFSNRRRAESCESWYSKINLVPGTLAHTCQVCR